MGEGKTLTSDDGRVPVSEGERQVQLTEEITETSLPDKPLVRRNVKRYKKLNDIPPSLRSRRAYFHHISKDLKCADKANRKIQNMQSRHISKETLVGGKIWTAEDLKKNKQHCQMATHKLTVAVKALMDHAKNNNPLRPDNFQPVAKCALRAFWLRDEIIAHTKSIQITQSLPEGIEKALHTKQKQSKDIKQMPSDGQTKLKVFNTAMSGFSGLLATTRLFLASLPDDMSKYDFIKQLGSTPTASDKKEVMYKDEYTQSAVKTDLLRKVTTKMKSFRMCLDADELNKLNSLYEGENAQIGGIDFIGHADGRALDDDFLYTRDVINQLQQHLLKLQHFAEELSVKYGLDCEYF